MDWFPDGCVMTCDVACAYVSWRAAVLNVQTPHAACSQSELLQAPVAADKWINYRPRRNGRSVFVVI